MDIEVPSWNIIGTFSQIIINVSGPNVHLNDPFDPTWHWSHKNILKYW